MRVLIGCEFSGTVRDAFIAAGHDAVSCDLLPTERHGEIKATCFWLNDLPPLAPTDIVDGRQPRVHHASPSPDRWKQRSITLLGIAKAMADQWGSVVQPVNLSQGGNANG